jgi:uncharacterized protein (TIGR04255 family)
VFASKGVTLIARVSLRKVADLPREGAALISDGQTSALPEYERPPVVEVVFATAIDPVPLSVVDLARFGLEQFGERFPIQQDQPPLQMATESFTDVVQRLAPTLALLEGTPPIRLWFQSEDRTRLVQLQRDLIAYNWQRASGEGPYPRYETIEPSFLEVWDKFAEFLEEHSDRPLKARQCELTYINHILAGDLWQHPGQLDKVIRLVGNTGSFLSEPEDGQFTFRYRLRHEERDVGRLYVQAAPALTRADRSPVIQLQLVARGAPLGEGRQGVREFFRLAHQWVVNGFAAVTTDEAQNILWGRTR